jgi:competence protein ComEC
VPAASYRIPSPRAPVVIGYYLFLLLLLARPRFKGQKPLTALLFAVFGLILVTHPFPPRYSPSLRLTFLDVGQGDSVLVEFPGRKKMLIDGGGFPNAGFDVGENVVSPFLWRHGIKKLDYLVLTHAHPDHLNGLLAVTRNFRVGEFWEAFSPEESPSYSALKSNLAKPCVRRRVFRGFECREGPVRLEVLHPAPDPPLQRKVSNDDSLVLRFTQDGGAVLLAADVGSGAEGDIVRFRPGIRSRILKSPHHGSRTSSSIEFLDAVGPEVVVISAGMGNSYGVPHPEVVERYRATGARVLRTDRDGAIEITVGGRGLLIRTAVPPAGPD